MRSKISIISAEPAGFALAADLKSGETSILVYLHLIHLRYANKIVENSCLRARNVIDSSTNPRVTFDMSEVINFSKFIMLTIQSIGQETVLRELKKFSLD